MFSQIFVLIVATITEIHLSQTYYKWFETTVHLIVKVVKSRILEGFSILSRDVQQF